MAILVTGGAGYIGSHVNLVLADQGASTIVVDDLSLGHRELVIAGEFVRGDFADPELLSPLFESRGIDAVVHLAAFTDVDDSIARPKAYYDNNVAKTLRLLDCMIAHGVRTFVFSSTSAVYAEDAEAPYSEVSPKIPICPYGRSKLMIEQVLEDYRTAYDLRYVTFRYFNAAGADPVGRIGEWHEPEVHLIPVVLEVAEGRRERITIFGTDYPTRDGTCIRDFVHVMDIASAHVRAIEFLEKGGDSDVFNLGYGTGTSVGEVIELCRRVTGREISATPSGRRPGDGAISIANCTRAMQVLRWKPRYDRLEDMVSTAWAWQQRLRNAGPRING